MSDPVFFPKGTVLKGYIKGQPGWYGSLRFEYKPLPTRDRDQLMSIADVKPADEYYVIARRLALRQLISWDASADGMRVPLNEASYDDLHPVLRNRLTSIVFVFQPPDLEPEAKPEEVDQWLADLEKDDPARDREEAQLKN